MSGDRFTGQIRDGDVGASIAYLDAAHWARLLQAGQDDSALASWLALQCSQVPGASRAVLVSRRTGPFRPVAFWPEHGATSRFLMETVNEALLQRIDLIRDKKETPDTVGIAQLVRQGSRVIAVVGVEVTEKSERARQEVLRRLQWGSAWVELFERRRAGESDEHAIERLTLALDAIAVAGEQTVFRAASAAALTTLALQMKAARVSFGVRRARGCRVAAVSNTTRFDRRVEQVRAIAQAMNEAVDQLAAVEVPEGSSGGQPLVQRDAVRLAEARGSSCVIVQPFVRGGKALGAMVFEWSAKEPPTPHIKEAVADVSALLAPVLYDRWLEERWLLTRAFGSLRRGLVTIVGPGYFGRKMTLLALAGIVAFFSVYKTGFRVTADARLRGAIERVIVAPLDGYVLEAPPRAGDTVKAGDLLAQLDDVEYQLERYAWTARKLQYETEYAQALAGYDRAGTNILRARTEEAEAQIRLNDTRIDLARLTAPFESVIVSGDLSQSLGQSVRRGDELFRIAPLDAYIVEIKVPESDVLSIEKGAKGVLVLTSLPTSSLGIRIENVTPVTSAGDGRNHFLVEAALIDPGSVPVSPGMEGVAKIEAGEKRLIWIWTRRLTEWARLLWWRWTP